MGNVTIALDEEILKASREYAKSHHTTLNRLIRESLARKVLNESDYWLDECFAQMDRANGNSRGRAWRRVELYDV